MENNLIINNAKKNIKLYKIYNVFSFELLFYYAISVLYLTITKNFSMSQVMYLSCAFSVSGIIFFIFGNQIVNKLGLKLSTILGNIFVLIHVILYICGSSFITFIIANIFNAVGFTLKNMSECNILYSSLNVLKKSNKFSEIEGKSNAKFYYYDAFASFICGFLFVYNNYLPMILCGINLIISFILSLFFKNVNKKEDTNNYSITNMLSTTKDILKSNRLKAIYLFAFIFTGIVSVSSTLYKAILIDIGIKDEYTTIIVCIASIFIAIGAKSLFNVEKMIKNKTLKLLSMVFIISLFIIGILGVLSKLNILSIIILLICLSLMGFVQGAYRVALKKYILSFTTSKIRNTVTSTYYISEYLGTALLSYILGLILNFTTNSIACIIFSLVNFIVIIFVINYMNGRLGLKPEQYNPKDINNVNIKDQ